MTGTSEDLTSPLSLRILDLLSDAKRLAAVRDTKMIDSPPEQSFDDLSSGAAMVMGAPVAQVTFFEDERQWFKSSRGLDLSEAPVRNSFCAYSVDTTDDVIIILDASADERFSSNPYVCNPPYVRFYAGSPIRMDGQIVGTVCVYDFNSREEVSPAQRTAMVDIAERAAALVREKRAV